MRLFFVDESGDAGWSGSRTYTLGCVMLDANTWPNAFDQILGFRRFLRSRYGIRLRDEIKANWLVRGGGGGDLRRLALGDQQRHAIYRSHMRLMPKIGVEVMAVVIDKSKINYKQRDPRDIAWEFLLQRIERYTTTGNVPGMLIHDEGDTLRVRGLARKARRVNTPGSAFGTGRFTLPARLLIDDPVPRNSSQSFFVQLADLSAYAAYRTVYPPPSHRPSVCPSSMWAESGNARSLLSNSVQTGSLGMSLEPGVSVWPH